MAKSFKTVGLLLIIILSLSCGGVKDFVPFKQINVGDQFDYKIVQETEIDFGILGQSKQATNHQALEVSIKIDRIWPDGSKDLDFTYGQIEVWQINDFKNLRFNSKLDKNVKNLPAAEKVFQKMVGRKIKMTLSPEGSITHFKGALKMYDEIFNEFNDPALFEFKEVVKAQLGDQALKELFGAFWNVHVPPKCVINNEWSTTDTLFTNVGGIYDNNYTLKAIHPSTLDVAIKSKISANPKASGLNFSHMLMQFDLSGEEKGIVSLSRDHHWPEKATTTKLLSGKMRMKTDMKGYEELSTDMVVKISTSLERLK